MLDQFSLQGPMLLPESGKPKKVVVLLHGYGAEGSNLLDLAYGWQPQVPEAAFICPDAPFPCSENPGGREWFPLKRWEPEKVQRDIRDTAPRLNTFIDQLLEKWSLGESDVAVMGFSQGAMMALYTLIRRPVACAGILAYSGIFIEDPSSSVSSYPDVFLFHGDQDEVVPFICFEQAKERLEALNFKVTPYKAVGAGHSITLEGLRLGGEFLQNKLRNT